MTDLTPALVRKHQVEPGWWFGVRHTAQWRDTDGYGHINHRAYLAWCEEARNRYLEAVGLPRLAIDQPSTTAGVDEFWFCGSSVIVWRAAGVVVASPTRRARGWGRAAWPRRDARGAGAPREP